VCFLIIRRNSMNIHKHQKHIRDLLQEGSRISGGKKPTAKKVYYPGCYILSRTLTQNLCKLGESHGQGGLYERIIGQYKVCMSLRTTEFYLKYLVITHRKKVGTRHFSQILEKALLGTIDSKVEDSYSKEYIFTPDIDLLEKRMSQVLKAHKDYFTVAIKFRPDGYQLYEENKGFKTRIWNFDRLPSLNPDANALIDFYKTSLATKKRPNKRIPTEGFFRKKQKVNIVD
jgi:hypothetical protein